MYQGDEELLGNKMTKSLLVFKLLRIKSTDSFCKKAMFCSLHPRRVAPTMGPSSSGDPMPPSGLLRQLHSCAHTHRHIIKNKTLKIPNCSLFLHPYPACSLVCIDLSLSLFPLGLCLCLSMHSGKGVWEIGITHSLITKRYRSRASLWKEQEQKDKGRVKEREREQMFEQKVNRLRK